MTTYTVPAHVELLARLAAAKASAQAVLTLSRAVADAEAALDEARAQATADAEFAYNRLQTFLGTQRDALDRIEAAGDVLAIVGDASDEECEAVLAINLGVEITEI